MSAAITMATKKTTPIPAPILKPRFRRYTSNKGRTIRSACFRKAYLRLFVSEATVSDEEVRLMGPTVTLAKAAADDSPLTSTAELVPSFVREWRPQGDSNPCYRRERAMS